jgi:hypothetical protein
MLYWISAIYILMTGICTFGVCAATGALIAASGSLTLAMAGFIPAVVSLFVMFYELYNLKQNKRVLVNLGYTTNANFSSVSEALGSFTDGTKTNVKGVLWEATVLQGVYIVAVGIILLVLAYIQTCNDRQDCEEVIAFAKSFGLFIVVCGCMATCTAYMLCWCLAYGVDNGMGEWTNGMEGGIQGTGELPGGG